MRCLNIEEACVIARLIFDHRHLQGNGAFSKDHRQHRALLHA
jgi:hypothetical protein